jgi:hypothetical protein
MRAAQPTTAFGADAVIECEVNDGRLEKNIPRTISRCCLAAGPLPMPDVIPNPPSVPCYSPVLEAEIEQSQSLDPDLFSSLAGAAWAVDKAIPTTRAAPPGGALPKNRGFPP